MESNWLHGIKKNICMEIYTFLIVYIHIYSIYNNLYYIYTYLHVTTAAMGAAKGD